MEIMNADDVARAEKMAKKRRLALLMSFLLLAYSVLCIVPAADGEYSGLKIHVLRPQYIQWLLLTLWFWSSWTWFQLLYESWPDVRVALEGEISREEDRIIVKWAARHISKGFRDADIDELGRRKKALCPGLKYIQSNVLTSSARRVFNFDGSRAFDRFMGEYSYLNADGTEGISTLSEIYTITKNEVRVLRRWAQIHSFIRLPTIAETFASALFVVFSITAFFWERLICDCSQSKLTHIINCAITTS